MSRKRRRQGTLKEQPEFEQDSTLTEEEIARARAEKEQEIWDTVREAHYEAIEQLPLTLQRQLALMRQLDEQAYSCGSRLLPLLYTYIKLRRNLAGKQPMNEETVEQEERNSRSTVDIATNSKGLTSPSTDAVMTPLRGTEDPATRIPTISNDQKINSSRDTAQQIAFMAEELLRASQEKVNLAQTNYDSVERHIHLLDQTIREQEASLSVDPSNPVHIHLPELDIPQWNRERKVTDGDLFPESDGRYLSEDSDKRPAKKKGSLTITLPAVQSNEEPLYCYCSRVSFGEMIACDNPSCKLEWFHLGCVGLMKPPEGEWFCEDCKSDDT